MDVIDRANEHAETLLAAAIDRQMGRSRYQGISLTECAECGESIPPQRQAALPGVKFCIHCQIRHERYGK